MNNPVRHRAPGKNRIRPIWTALLALLLLAGPGGPVQAAGQATTDARATTTKKPNPRRLKLRSATALVLDLNRDQVLYAKNASRPMPIASITKLMTAMVILDAKLAPNEKITITEDDKDRLRHSRSRLPVGAVLTRDELLHLALVGSENRAAAALGRTYPDGKTAFLKAMNRKARSLGMARSKFLDPTGLDAGNTASAEDLVRMLQAAYAYPRIRAITTLPSYTVTTEGKVKEIKVNNTNLLVRKPRRTWDIGLSKTGFIREAGRCLVMQAKVAERSLLIVLLNSWGKYTTVGDSNRIRKWLAGAS